MPPAVELVIDAKPADLGGFEVRRTLPHATRRMVGPFIFWDEMGPAQFPPGSGIDVPPHPHIGLATITYLFEGEMLHRDSVGSVQPIRPGDVNWMTAGRGITHSERTSPESRATGQRLHGIQSWIALPKSEEEREPAFFHHPRANLPEIALPGARVHLIAGEAFGARSPVEVLSPMLYAAIALDPGARLALPADQEERAVYVVAGRVSIGGHGAGPGQLLILTPGETVQITAEGPARLMNLGGAPLDGPRHIWWNFVSSSRERIETAKADWRNGNFPPVPDDDAFMPLP